MSELTEADVREVWEDILPGLRYVKEKTAAPWRVEDVYATCLVGQAHIFRCPTGFVILQDQPNPFTGRRELLVWVAYAEGQWNAAIYQPALDDLARKLGYSTLVMWSPRKGFERSSGWTATYTRYERQV